MNDTGKISLKLLMLNNGMMIIGKFINNKGIYSNDDHIYLADPRAIILGQSTQGSTVSIQNIPFMFSKQICFHAETITADTSDGFIDENIKKSYLEAVSGIKIATISPTLIKAGNHG